MRVVLNLFHSRQESKTEYFPKCWPTPLNLHRLNEKHSKNNCAIIQNNSCYVFRNKIVDMNTSKMHEILPFLFCFLNFIWNRSLLCRAGLSQPMWGAKLLAGPPPSHSLSLCFYLLPSFFIQHLLTHLQYVSKWQGNVWKINTARNRGSEGERGQTEKTEWNTSFTGSGQSPTRLHSCASWQRSVGPQWKRHC